MFTILDLSDDIVTEWSSRGPVEDVSPKPDYTSPGESIIGPWLSTEKIVSGTSMATPFIAGGIASKNKEIFKSKEFFDEFENVYRRKEVLKEIPIYIIINYEVSLIGACLAAMYHSDL